MARRPNIVLIYADELRYDCLGNTGNRVIKTPNIDRLALEGLSFDQAHVSFPLCTPFRASLYTGKYSHSAGVYANHHPIPLNHDFLAEKMKEAGYQTGYIGKWHLEGGPAPGYIPPGPRRLGFDHFVGFNRGHYYLNSIYYKDSEQPYHNPRYEPDFQTEHFTSFMAESIEKDPASPFFGVICYGAPHFPFAMPEYYKQLYRPDEVPVGPTVADRKLQERVREEAEAGNFPLASGFWGMEDPGEYESEEYVRRFTAYYYGMIANLDYNVGRILDWLDHRNLKEDTMVIFLSDHGDMLGEHGYRCGTKKTAYDQAMHVPFIVRYPGICPAGTRTNVLIDVAVDSMPTLLDLVDVPIPSAVEGCSFASALRGEAKECRDAVFYEIDKEEEGPERFPIPERGLRTREWVYVRTEAKPKMLFDLKRDPQELTNVVDAPEYAETRKKLDARLARHMADTNDDWSAEAHFPPAGFQTHEEKSVTQKQLLADAIVEY